jgi:hypothetical protein
VRHVAEGLQPAPQYRPAEDDEPEQGEREGDDLDRDQLPHGGLHVLHGRRGDEDDPGADLAGAQLVRALARDVRGAQQMRVAPVRQRLCGGGEFGGVGGDVGGLAQDRRMALDVVHGGEPAVVRPPLDGAVRLGVLGLGDLDELHLLAELTFQVVLHVRRQGRAEDGEHDEGHGW